LVPLLCIPAAVYAAVTAFEGHHDVDGILYLLWGVMLAATPYCVSRYRLRRIRRIVQRDPEHHYGQPRLPSRSDPSVN
jgi:hypothetical protein